MKFVTVLIACACCVASTLHAEDSVGVYLESLDTIDKHVRLIYMPPESSVYANEGTDDTVFCCIDAQTAWWKRATVLPMRRESKRRYVVESVFPDSTYAVRIEICFPTDRLPDGIVSFTVGPKGGYAWVDTVITDAKLNALVASKADDPILHNYYLWNDYFYPVKQGETYAVPKERIEKTFELAKLFPRSEMGQLWIERYNDEKKFDVGAIKKMIDAWRTSWDSDVLGSIAHELLKEESGLYDPKDALWFIERAQESSVKQIAFRTGENIYSSMGRIDSYAATRTYAVGNLGRYDEAVKYGMESYKKAQNQYGRSVIVQSLQRLAKKNGDSALVKKLSELSLPSVKNISYTTMDGKTASLEDHKGKIVVMDFWFAGCVGCAAEHDALNALAKQYSSDTSVVFLSFSLNDARTLKRYLAKRPLGFQVIPDAESLCDKIGVTAYPTHIILDKKGETNLWETGGSSMAVENLQIAIITLGNE